MQGTPHPVNPDRGSPGLGHLADAAPPLPSTIVRARRLMDRTDGVSPEQVLDAVRHDPVVVSRILRVANAAHYGTQRTVHGIGRAIQLLGPMTVLGIVTGMHIVSSPSPAAAPSGYCFLRLVRHSVATGYLVEALNAHLPAPFPPDMAYTAGLLHDLGRILLASHDPEGARSVYADPGTVATGSAEELLALEQVAFGFDHTEAGEYVARRLDFPELLVSAIRNHHRPEGGSPNREAVRLARLVGLADAAASSLGYPARDERPADTFDGHAAWTALGFADAAAALAATRARAASMSGVVDGGLGIRSDT